jgi:hypothetical protein
MFIQYNQCGPNQSDQCRHFSMLLSITVHLRLIKKSDFARFSQADRIQTLLYLSLPEISEIKTIFILRSDPLSFQLIKLNR